MHIQLIELATYYEYSDDNYSPTPTNSTTVWCDESRTLFASQWWEKGHTGSLVRKYKIHDSYWAAIDHALERTGWGGIGSDVTRGMA